MKLHVNKHTFGLCEVVKGNTGKKKPKYRVGWENRNKNKKVVNSKESLSTQKIAVFGDKWIFEIEKGKTYDFYLNLSKVMFFYGVGMGGEICLFLNAELSLSLPNWTGVPHIVTWCQNNTVGSMKEFCKEKKKRYKKKKKLKKKEREKRTFLFYFF